MIIVQLVTRRQLRGAEVFAAGLSDALTDRGHEVFMVGLSPASGAALNPRAAAVVDLPVLRSSRFSLRKLNELLRLIHSIRPDIVQANGSSTLKYSSIAKRLSNDKWPLIYRNISIASDWVRSEPHRLWVKALLAGVDHVACVSEVSSADLAKTYGVPEAKRTVIHRGMDPIPAEEKSRVRHRLSSIVGVHQIPHILMHVGRFSEEKNHSWLIAAFDLIRERSCDVHLFLVGDGPLRKEAEENVSRRGLQHCVHFLGERYDASRLMAGADLLVLTSKIEGIPGVVMEASLHQVPTVATDVGGVGEVVEHNRTGVLVQPGDLHGFSEAVINLLEDSSRREKMGACAREVVERKFSLEKAVSEFEDLYGRLLHDRRGAVTGIR